MTTATCGAANDEFACPNQNKRPETTQQARITQPEIVEMLENGFLPGGLEIDGVLAQAGRGWMLGCWDGVGSSTKKMNEFCDDTIDRESSRQEKTGGFLRT